MDKAGAAAGVRHSKMGGLKRAAMLPAIAAATLLTGAAARTIPTADMICEAVSILTVVRAAPGSQTLDSEKPGECLCRQGPGVFCDACLPRAAVDVHVPITEH